MLLYFTDKNPFCIPGMRGAEKNCRSPIQNWLWDVDLEEWRVAGDLFEQCRQRIYINCGWCILELGRCASRQPAAISGCKVVSKIGGAARVVTNGDKFSGSDYPHHRPCTRTRTHIICDPLGRNFIGKPGSLTQLLRPPARTLHIST